MSTIEALTHEFPVAIDSEAGFGVPLVTDLALMVRPALAGQYHSRCPHDSERIIQIMNLGDHQEDGHGPVWHISTSLGLEEAHQLMHMGWWAYFDYFCMAKVWIDAEVRYIGAGGETIATKGYGFTDGRERGVVYVYTKEFWKSVHTNGDPSQTDWAPLLKQARIIDDESNDVFPLNELEKKLSSGVRSLFGMKLVLVQPSTDAPNGYTAHGFEIEMR